MSRALVVDDDRGMVRTLTDILRLRGWDVDTAFDGNEAVDAVARTPYDVVIMDVKMPGMDGVSAFRAMRTRRPTQRVVLMTAYTRSDVMQEVRRGALPATADLPDVDAEGGVAATLRKPFRIEKLFELLDDDRAR